MSCFIFCHILNRNLGCWKLVVILVFSAARVGLSEEAENSAKTTRNLFGIFAARPPQIEFPFCRRACSSHGGEYEDGCLPGCSAVQTGFTGPCCLHHQGDEQSLPKSCGERNDGSRIVGGKPTQMNEFPWMARLSYFNRFYCGGMLINDRYVLTAAHCVKGFMWFMIKVTFGEHDRCNDTRKPESRFVLRAITGDFSFMNFDHDIALLRLNDKVPISDNIRPICLPNNTDALYDGVKAVVSGWGTTKEDGKPSCILQQVEVPVMSNQDCRKNTKYNEKMISDNMLCAGYPEGMKDSCQGDSGGPLATEREDKKFELIGIVSWGNGCARPGYPGVYTRVTRYVAWIKDNSRDGCYCQD